MDVSLIFIVMLIAGLIAFSAYFAFSETSYTGMNVIRVKALAYEGDKKAERALENYENYDRLLTTILIGNNVVNAASTTLVTMLCTELLGTVGVVVAAVVAATVLLIFGEITPKTLAKRNAERYALKLSGSIHMTMVILAPISWAFMRLAHALSKNAKNDSAEAPSFTEDELYVMIDEVAEEGALERSEGELVKSAMQFDDIKVSEMYTPKANIAAVDIRAGMEEVKTTFMKSEYSRIPVYDDSIDRIIGAVHSKDFFYKYIEGEDIILEDMIRPVKFVGEDMIIATLLSDLQKSHIHVAIVVDGDGRTLGMVTMEDILEELVGEIWDERDEAVHPIHEERDGSFTVPGEANIFEVMKRIGMDFNPGDFQDHSVSAFISHNMDRVPKKGDMIDMGESKIIVRSMKSRRVREARILPVKKEVSPQEDRGS